MCVQTRLQSARHKRVDALVISISPCESERKASSRLNLLRDSVKGRPKAEEPATSDSLGETVMHGRLSEESTSQASLILSEQARVIVELLKEMCLVIVLVVNLQELTRKSQLLLVSTSRVVK